MTLPSTLNDASVGVAGGRPTSGGVFYLPQLDGLRFLAFCAVFIHHAPVLLVGNSALDAILVRAHVFGWAGVDLFLTLSGFLITRLLVLEWDRTGQIQIGVFYVRRALRIWPLYVLALICGIGVFPALHVFGSGNLGWHRWSFPFFLGNWSVAVHGYPESPLLAPLWTISLEEQFYLVWPWLVRWSLSSGRKLSSVCLAMLLLSLAARALSVAYAPPHPFIWSFTLTRLDPLALGALLGSTEGWKFISSRLQDGKVPLSTLGLALGVITVLGGPIELQGISVVWQFLATAAASTCFLCSTLVSPHLAGALSSRQMVYLGKMSYGLYVFHFGVLAIVRALLLHIGVTAPLVILVLGLVVVCIGSWLSYELYEKRFLVIKERFAIVRSRPVGDGRGELVV